MTYREEDIDLLKSLCIIEGAVMNSGDDVLKNVVTDELDWIVDMLVKRLKGSK